MLGVMQGRLTGPIDGKIQAFPSGDWQNEFGKARQCGLELIEWIFDRRENPLMTAQGLDAIRALSASEGVGVVSVCADYFLDCPLARGSDTERAERTLLLQRLIAQSAHIGIRFITIPFLDHSELRTRDEFQHAADSLRRCAPLARASGITLCLETSLNPKAFRDFLMTISHPNVQVNYDIGNSAGLGYDPLEEFSAYGDWVATVHIKDRQRGASTVPLGMGNADFETVFKELENHGYAGPFILQGARQPGDPMETIRRYIAFVKKYLNADFRASDGS